MKRLSPTTSRLSKAERRSWVSPTSIPIEVTPSGPSHRDTLVTVSNLAHLYYDIGRFQEAEVLFERSLAGFEKLLGSNDPSTLGAMNNLANILKKRGQYRAARRLYRTAKAGKG